MNKFFELRENDEVLFGVIENIPEEVTLEKVKERIESEGNGKSIQMTEKKTETPDIVFDWETLDYEESIDQNLIDVSDSMLVAIELGLETEVVYTALETMKKNSELTISEAIKIGFDKWA